MPYISKDFIKNKLMPNLDIVQVLQQYLPLKKSGANYQCCCPFHNEKTPSFTVTPSRQFFHCFGCQTHGTVIDFVMKYKNESFPEAVEELARYAGLEVEYDQDSNYAQSRAAVAAHKQPYYELLDRVAAYFTKELYQHPEALDYFTKQRQLKPDVISKARLGFAPKDFYSIQKNVIKSEAEAKILLELGVVKENLNGDADHKYRSFFIDRVMFPIFDVKGRIIGFGGRILKGDGPKYLNSPESEIFQKRRELFGLYECLQATRNRPDKIVIVEGYLDVIALRQAGFTNVVATLGTASNSEHFKQLFRYTNNVVCCYDGDAAGQKASWKALQAVSSVLPEDKDVRFATLPPGDDPDSLVRAQGIKSFEAVIDSSVSFTEKLVRHCRDQEDVTDIEGLRRFLNLSTSIAKTLSVSRQLAVFKLLCGITGYTNESLTEIMRSIPPHPDFVSPEERGGYQSSAGRNERGGYGAGSNQGRYKSYDNSRGSSNTGRNNQSFQQNALTPFQGSFAHKAYGYGAQVQAMQRQQSSIQQQPSLQQQQGGGVSQANQGLNQGQNFGQQGQGPNQGSNQGQNWSQNQGQPWQQGQQGQQGGFGGQGPNQNQQCRSWLQAQQPNGQFGRMQHNPNGSWNNGQNGQSSQNIGPNWQSQQGPNNYGGGNQGYQNQAQGNQNYGQGQGYGNGNNDSGYNQNQQHGYRGKRQPYYNPNFPYNNQDQGNQGQGNQGQFQNNQGQFSGSQGHIQQEPNQNNKGNSSNLQQGNTQTGFPSSVQEIQGKLIEVNPASCRPLYAGDIYSRAFVSSLTDDERYTYYSLVGQNYRPEDLNSSIYFLLAFILQEPAIVRMSIELFRYEFFMALCQAFRVPEYPCLERLLRMIVTTSDLTSAKILEEFRDTEFYQLFNDLIQFHVLGRFHRNIDNLSSQDLMMLEHHLIMMVLWDALDRRLQQLRQDIQMPRYKELEANLVRVLMRFTFVDGRYDQKVDIDLCNKLSNKITDMVNSIMKDQDRDYAREALLKLESIGQATRLEDILDGDDGNS